MSLAHAIMSSLQEEEQSGYDLAQYFVYNMADFWQASHQQIYSQLKNLREKQWVVSREVQQTGKPNRILYKLTSDGSQELERWVLEETPSRKTKDALLVKLYNLAPSNAEHLYKEIEHKMYEKQKRLKMFYRIAEKTYPNPEALTTRKKGVYIVLRAGILDAEQFVEWCEESMRVIEKLKSKP